jgi:hypothetical protein
MFPALTNERVDRSRDRLRRLGQLIALTAVYQRPGMPVEHVLPVTDRSRVHDRLP